jgi:beta-lactam-binding protein with PASTA domain
VGKPFVLRRFTNTAAVYICPLTIEMQLIRFLFTRMFAVNLLAFIVLLALLFWGLSSWMSGYTLHNTGIAVPHLRGYHLSEARLIATAADLELVVSDSIYVENVPGGTITEQHPDSGTKVKSGRKLYVTLSTYNIPKIVLPNLKYDDQRNVISQLEMLGFRVGEIKYVPSTCVDCLEYYEQKGAEVLPGSRLNNGATIDLVLGGGKSDRFIPIPDLRGMKLEEALAFLKRCSLSIGRVNIEPLVSADSNQLFVYKQTPEALPASEVIYLGMPVDLYFTDNTDLLPTNTVDTDTVVPLEETEPREE